MVWVAVSTWSDSGESREGSDPKQEMLGNRVTNRRRPRKEAGRPSVFNQALPIVTRGVQTVLAFRLRARAQMSRCW